MKIKNYNEYTSQQTLYIFDFDDTLVETPSFEELAIQYLKEEISIKDMIDASVKKIGASISDLRWQDDRIFITDPLRRLSEYGNWVRKGDRLYMVTPNIFCSSDLSLPTGPKELTNFYRKVENKCIVTAREENMREKVEKILNDYSLEIPKFGLHMAPNGQKNLGTWKGHKIVEIIENTGFTKAIFYDDNPKYIRNASKVIREKLPDLDFQAIKVI